MMCFLKINCALDYKSQKIHNTAQKQQWGGRIFKGYFYCWELQGDCNKSSLPVESFALPMWEQQLLCVKFLLLFIVGKEEMFLWAI